MLAPPQTIRAFRNQLHNWYRRHQRPLPWRTTRDAYAIWISEVMAQQTRMDTVIPYYHRFLARFPHVAALAGADQQAVLKLWEGLGYYRRAADDLNAATLFGCQDAQLWSKFETDSYEEEDEENEEL